MTDTTQEELPPLPEQDCCTHVTDSETMDLFRADQMRDYARQCIATLKAENRVLEKAANIRIDLQLAAEREAATLKAENERLRDAQTADARELREALRCHGETVPCESCDCPMGAAARKFDAAIAAIQRERDSK